jgi:RNA polymerase sigma-70 factor (ECF subfamily)
MNFVEVPDRVQEAELERIMTQYGSSLKRMCYLYLRDASLAEDAAQDTFLKAYKKLGTFKHESTEQSWLMRIAINTCKDYRRSFWFLRVDRKAALESLPEADNEPFMIDSTVVDEVMRLPAKYKVVILLRYYQEMKLKQISETLGIPLETARSRLKHANKVLHQRLERWYFDE